MLIDACTEGLRRSRRAVPISGVGPPPEADPAALVTAQFLPFVGDTVAGRTFSVAVNIQPRGLWDFTALPLPDALEVVASHPGEPALASAPLLPGAQPGTPCSGRLTIPETGPVELTVQVPNPDGVAGVVAANSPSSRSSRAAVADRLRRPRRRRRGLQRLLPAATTMAISRRWSSSAWSLSPSSVGSCSGQVLADL